MIGRVRVLLEQTVDFIVPIQDYHSNIAFLNFCQAITDLLGCELENSKVILSAVINKEKEDSKKHELELKLEILNAYNKSGLGKERKISDYKKKISRIDSKIRKIKNEINSLKEKIDSDTALSEEEKRNLLVAEEFSYGTAYWGVVRLYSCINFNRSADTLEEQSTAAALSLLHGTSSVTSVNRDLQLVRSNTFLQRSLRRPQDIQSCSTQAENPSEEQLEEL